MKIVSFLSSFLALACLCAAKPKKDVPYIYLRPTDTLYIQVMDSVYMNSSMGETDRFHRIEKTLEDVFEDINFPLAYKIERFGAQQTPPNQPRLDLTIFKWGDNGLSEVEARFSASIKRDYNRNKLGIFFTRSPSVFGGYDRVIRAHNEVMEEAIAEMVVELNTRLSVGLLEEEKEVEAEGEDDVSESE
ncbi:hypothetical protein IEN85_15490 [Pelagicoccus sp. NFK12]|uniref:Uncharacterized protein n=1 Tax=Pelagicoccus enzymogenes TaxID=2773457 RepID=A0A927F9D5_9BACT|nr:hypothetical protein [Pelagicoccus enzymogenes]MBD5780902.1 hypothetical protein [Pelagicoccus enzymogenes]MDQ8199940.1 hypothetical protein [Pelagicoccus enzymogenes]